MSDQSNWQSYGYQPAVQSFGWSAVQSFGWSVVQRYYVPNKRVALQPFPDEVQPNKVVNGVLKVMARQDTIGLKVVFGNEIFMEGQVCYVRSDRKSTSTWGKEVREVNGQKFILVPEDEIVVVDRTPLVGAESPEAPKP